jgi:parvulin-like peptidyl-prolyl isomerase
MSRIFLPLLVMTLQTALPALAADTDVVARMGDIALTVRDARQLIESNSADTLSPEALERLVRTEVIRRSLIEEARRQSFDKNPEIAARMQRASEQALVSAYMNERARPPKDFPSEDLIRQAYEANKPAFTTPLQYRVSQIYVAGTDKAALRKAEDLHAQAAKKDGFAETARKFSQHAASAAQGGDMGWLTEKDLMPAIRKPLSELKKGDIGKPVLGSEGYHILMLADIRKPEALPLDKARPALIQNLRLRKAAELEAAYLDKLVSKTPVMVNGISLSELAGR